LFADVTTIGSAISAPSFDKRATRSSLSVMDAITYPSFLCPNLTGAQWQAATACEDGLT
jgi:hypothetical protein